MIYLYEARPGQGKSVYATYKILSAIKRKKYYVATNIQDIDIKNERFKKVQTWKDIERVIYEHLAHVGKGREGSLLLVLDELSLLLDARSWDTLPTQVKFILRQHRKFGVDVIGFSQSVKDIDTVYRRLVQRLFVIKKIFVWRYKIPFGFFWVREYDSDDVDKDRSERNALPILTNMPELLFIDPWVFWSMDSWALFVPPPQVIEVRHYTHKCEDSNCTHTKVIHAI